MHVTSIGALKTGGQRMYKLLGLLLTLTIVCLTSSSLLLASDDGYVPPQLLRVFFTDRNKLKALADSGIDLRCAGRGPGYIDVIVEAGPLTKSHPAHKVLKGFQRVDVRVENLDKVAEKYRDKADLGLYHNFEEVVEELRAYTNDYPNLAQLHELGKSHEGRNVYALKVSGNVTADEGEPGFLICGMHHSREWISVEVVMAFAKELLEGYASDSRIKNIVDNREIWLVPVQNPDGFVYSTTKYRMWRKNRRKNSGSSYGVDPNRNYSYEWGGAGASTSPGSDTYRGPSAGSEPITQIIEGFVASRKNLKGSISFHSYGQLILWPWSYTYDPAPDDAILGDLARQMAKFTGYSPKQSSDLYPSSGDFDDSMYGGRGLASFTFELATSFIPDESKIAPICKKNVKALTWFVENATDPFPILRHQPLGATTDNGPYALSVVYNKGHHANFGLKKVLINWKKDGQSQGQLTLKGQGSDAYGVELPSAGLGTYSYHFEAVGKDGSAVRFPAEGEFSFQVVDSLYLLVDDDGGRQYESYYTNVFEELGLPVAVHDRSKGAVTAQQLAGATGVVWFCGSESSNTLDSKDQKVLKEYLSTGGKLLLFGQDVAYNLKNKSFLKDVLKTKFVKDSASSKELQGLSGTFLAGVDFSITGSDSVSQSYPEVVKPLEGAFALANYKNDTCGAVARADENCRMAFFGIGLEGIDGGEKRKEVLGKGLEWLVSDKALELKAGTALHSKGINRHLAITGAARTENLASELLQAVEEGRFEEVTQTLESVENRSSIRPMLRTLRRRLVGDEREGAQELRQQLINWME